MPEVMRAVCPHDCPDTCLMLVTVDDGGRAPPIDGDPAHPFTQGFLCTKVSKYLERTYHPERLTYPQIPAGGKGEGRFCRGPRGGATGPIAGRGHAVIA